MLVPRLWKTAAIPILVLAVSQVTALEPRLRESAGGMQLVLEIPLPDPDRIETDLDGVSFTHLHFPGLRPEGEPGTPQLWVETHWIALPPGGTATLRVVEAEREELGTLRLLPAPEGGIETVTDARGVAQELPRSVYIYDRARYEGPATRLEEARLGEPAMLRHQRVVPLEIRPLQYDARSGRTTCLRRIVVEITMRPGAEGRDAAGAGRTKLATSPAWERIYAGSIVNARSAAAWRRAPQRVPPTGAPLKSGLLRPGLLGEEAWKLRVTQTGPVRVLAQTLLDAGFPDGTPVSALRLVLERYNPALPLEPDILEIPILVEDGDGFFRSGDSFVFYGEDPRDDTTSEDRLMRYSGSNVYWLSIATSGTPPRMVPRPRLAAPVPGPATFEQDLTYERDSAYNAFVYGRNTDPGDTEALYFWTPIAPSSRIRVAVPGRVANADLNVCVRTQEDYLQRAYQLFVRTGARDSVLLGSDPGTQPTPTRPPPVKTVCGAASAAALDPGDVTIILRPFGASAFVPQLENIRLRYTASYAASGNAVHCTSGGASGDIAFPISGFTDSNLRAFDITDPKNPAVFDLTGAYAAGTLTLHDRVPVATTRTYLVVPSATIPSIAAERDVRDDILTELATSPLGTYDCLVVSHDSFAGAASLASWIAFRESLGHRIRLVKTSDVYDAFRGGLEHYEAIHRMCRQAFENWGIEFVLLVGDGSEDTRHLQPESGPNFVPARVRYFTVTSSSGGDAQHRNDMNDKFYTQVAGGVSDPIPDLLLGRWPVGSVAELDAVVQKTIRYETPQPGDDSRWRKRVLMFSDDEWVKRNEPDVSPVAHVRGCVERDFQRSIMRACDIVDRAFPGDLQCVPFYLRDHSDLLYPRVPEHRPVSLDSTCFQSLRAPHSTSGLELAFYQADVGRALVDSVGEGVLFFALQSHANRSVVTDEFVMNTLEVPFAPHFRNRGKPFVFFGLGCHLNEYAVASENGFRATSGDALGERLVLEPERGAVASYASTGFEYLQQNNWFHEGMWSQIFDKRWSIEIGGRSVNSDTLEARWLLAEQLQIAEVLSGGGDIIMRYVLLGDPMLRIDAGVPRVSVDRITNGVLQPDLRLAVQDRNLPVGLEITLNDEQGIDSLWVVQRFRGGQTLPIPDVRITSRVDTLPQIRAKRSFTVAFEIDVAECNFDIVVGARDVAGRSSEFVAHVLFEGRLHANGFPITNDEIPRVDPRTAFRFDLFGCAPVAPPLPLEVYLDGALRTDVVVRPDSLNVNWKAEFVSDLPNGRHTLRLVYDGFDLSIYTFDVGSFDLYDVIAFPNPMRKQHKLMRIYFHLGAPITGGWLRILDLNGRTVLRQNLRQPGVVQSDHAVPAGSIGTGVGQDATHWNYVAWDGRDGAGDLVGNGVYLYELQVEDASGKAQRKRDKLVIMR